MLLIVFFIVNFSNVIYASSSYRDYPHPYASKGNTKPRSDFHIELHHQDGTVETIYAITDGHSWHSVNSITKGADAYVGDYVIIRDDSKKGKYGTLEKWDFQYREGDSGGFKKRIYSSSIDGEKITLDEEGQWAFFLEVKDDDDVPEENYKNWSDNGAWWDEEDDWKTWFSCARIAVNPDQTDNNDKVTIHYTLDSQNGKDIKSPVTKTFNAQGDYSYEYKDLSDEGFTYTGKYFCDWIGGTSFGDTATVSIGNDGNHYNIYFIYEGNEDDIPDDDDDDYNPPSNLRAALEMENEDCITFDYEEYLDNDYDKTRIKLYADESEGDIVNYNFTARLGGDKKIDEDTEEDHYAESVRARPDDVSSDGTIHTSGKVIVTDSADNEDSAHTSDTIDVDVINDPPTADFSAKGKYKGKYVNSFYVEYPTEIEDRSTDPEGDKGYLDWRIKKDGHTVLMAQEVLHGIYEVDGLEDSFNYSDSYIQDASIDYTGNIDLTFKQDGIYEIQQTIYDYLGESDTYNNSINVETEPEPPTAVIDAVDYAFAGDPIQIKDGSTDPNGDINQWDWTIPSENTTGSLSGENGGELTFAKKGTYTVGLKVTDATDLSDSTTKDLTVIPQIPVVKLEGEDTTKQNRKYPITIENSLSPISDPIQTARNEWTIEPLDGQNSDSIKIDPDTSTAMTKNMLFKEPGDYRINIKLHNNYTDANPHDEDIGAREAEIMVHVSPDEAPEGEIIIQNGTPNFTDNPKSILVTIKSNASSPDSDIVQHYDWNITRDNDEDDSFEDETPFYSLNEDLTTAITFPVTFELNNNGLFQADMNVQEEFGQETIEKYVTEDDRRATDITQTFAVNWVPDIKFDLPDFAYTDDIFGFETEIKDERVSTCTVDWSLKRADEDDISKMNSVELEDYTYNNLKNEGGAVEIFESGYYELTAAVTDELGQSYSYSDTIRIYPLPTAVISDKLKYCWHSEPFQGKQNRRFDIDGNSSYGSDYYGEPLHAIDHDLDYWEITPLDNQDLDSIKILDEDTNTAKISENGNIFMAAGDNLDEKIVFKETGQYKVRYQVTNQYGKKSPFAEQIITIAEDQAPYVAFDLEDKTYRNNVDGNNASLSNYNIIATSPDDEIAGYTLKYRFDSDNDGTYTDERWSSNVSIVDGSAKVRVDHVGKYQFRLYAKEKFAQETIDQFINASDVLKATAYKEIEVDNKAPYVYLDFNVIKSKKTDVIFTYVNEDGEETQLVDGVKSLSTNLKNAGVDAQVKAVNLVDFRPKITREDIISDHVAMGFGYFMAINGDGSVGFADESHSCSELTDWTDIVQLASDGKHIFYGLKKDGTVLLHNFASGTGQLYKTRMWKDIKQIEAAGNRVIGLESGGKVVVENSYQTTAKQDKEDVSEWKNIVQVDCTKNYFYGLQSDGLIVTTSNYYHSNEKNFIQVSSSKTNNNLAYGLKSDGTVKVLLDSGPKTDLIDEEVVQEIESWKNVIAIEAGDTGCAAIMPDGTIKLAGVRKSTDDTTYQVTKKIEGRYVGISFSKMGYIRIDHTGKMTGALAQFNDDEYFVVGYADNDKWDLISREEYLLNIGLNKIQWREDSTKFLIALNVDELNELDEDSKEQSILISRLLNDNIYFSSITTDEYEDLIHSIIKQNNNKGRYFNIGSTQKEVTVTDTGWDSDRRINSNYNYNDGNYKGNIPLWDHYWEIKRHQVTIQGSWLSTHRSSLEDRLNEDASEYFDDFKKYAIENYELTNAEEDRIENISAYWRSSEVEDDGYKGSNGNYYDYRIRGAWKYEIDDDYYTATYKGTVDFVGNLNDLVLSSNLNDIYVYVTSIVKDDKKSIKYVLLNSDKLEYKVDYTDVEKDSQYDQGYWMYKHNPNYFTNSLGKISYDNKWINNNITSFDKTGKYLVTYHVKDNPVGSEENFANYRYWSTMPNGKLELFVHRKPVAVPQVTYTKSGDYLYLTYKDSSYDLDHENRVDKGLVIKKWEYMKFGDTSWTTGKLAKIYKADEYFIKLTVRDMDGENNLGEWSDEVVLLITDNPQPPIAQFERTPSVLPVDQKLNITDTSYDPNGDPIVQWEWKLYKEDTLIGTYSNTSNLKDYSSRGTGNYTLTLKVQDDTGLWSNICSKEFEVIPVNKAPIIDFKPLPNPIYIFDSYDGLGIDPMKFNVSVNDPNTDNTGFTYSWTFDNYKVKDTDLIDTDTDPDLTYTYDTKIPFTNDVTAQGLDCGAYKITLTVEDQPPVPPYDTLDSLSTTVTKDFYIIPRLDLDAHHEYNEVVDTTEKITPGESVKITAATNKFSDHVKIIDPNGTTQYMTLESQDTYNKYWTCSYTIPEDHESNKLTLRVITDTKWGGHGSVTREKETSIELNILTVKLYDFAITNITDYSMEGLVDSSIYVSDLAYDKNNNTENKLMKKGYAFYFELKSKGLKGSNDFIRIRPTFYALNKSTGKYDTQLNMYYKDKDENFVQATTDPDSSRDPNDVLKIYFEREEENYLGYHREINLPTSLRTKLSSTEQQWVGRYGVPADSFFFKKGDAVSRENLYEGKVLIMFDIEAMKNGQAKYNYIGKGQWNDERRAAGGSIKSEKRIYQDGSVIVIDSEHDITDDFESRPVWR